ncbi:DUF6519 domain-containing protein [Streptomyces sp. Caat 7-52]|uniref:DUF6519 domain-containing protein n=1 Tax=Streptomyces sp. Caat 7-52 TaxID=2949637 RepID=UPI002036244C|nr:DUF6519 domain-containing protein [Streptomyces sp. Caat 7-52]
MHGDFTRWTFSPRQGYRSVLLQQGRVLLDADWNEQAEIIAHHDESRAADLAGVSGGPLDGAGFAIVQAGGSEPRDAAWDELRITPGRFYVDGVLVDAVPPATDPPAPFAGWPLGDQPHVGALAGEPAESSQLQDGAYAVVLDVWTHHVTADEQPSLRESALGGPDTTTRAQTVWRVRLSKVEDDADCAGLHSPGRFSRPHGTMVAALVQPDPSDDPCRITASGGYQRLENQLYRVEIHATGPGAPVFLWSRENGSVVAGLSALTPHAEPGSAELTLDRAGRDEELSIRENDTVEVTSVDLQLRAQPGFLATAQAPNGLSLPVRWADPHAAPASLAALGRTPLIRRWEGPPRAVSTTAQDLEAGIQVHFPEGGSHTVGDYWLIPARTTRQVYGMTTLAGTIDWPDGPQGQPAARPPLGPRHHVAPLALLRRKDGRWSGTDCRRLFPALTQLVTLDLVGGDGQEALPGRPLPHPVRVAVRNGGRPVPGARVAFTPSGGVVASSDGTVVEGPVTTGPDGVAAVVWTLAGNGAPAQTLTARLLGHAVPRDAPSVTVTGRLSTASQVSWAPPAGCTGLSGAATVADALRKLAGRAELRLLGGDGQHLRAPDKVLPQPVRVVLDSPCGPLAGQTVTATASQGSIVKERTESETTAPATLTGTSTATAQTAPNGTAAFWWQPGTTTDSHTLDLKAQTGGDASITVSSQNLPTTGGGPTGPVTAESVTWTPAASCSGLSGVTHVKGALDRLAGKTQLRLLGGDGQHLRAPDKVLPQPVRVVLDSPCGPLAGQTVTATASQGSIVKERTESETTAPATLTGTSTATAQTAPNGTAAFWWQPGTTTDSHTLDLNLQGATSASLTLTAQRLPSSVPAEAVSWGPPPGTCPGFSGVTHVRGALDTLVGKEELRLLGGDGQQLRYGLPVLPEPVRVIVDSPCGPLAGRLVRATASGGSIVKAKADTETTSPAILTGAATATAQTDSHGAAAFWWQPNGQTASNSLRIGLDGDTAREPVTVTSQSPRTPGVHITKIAFVGGGDFGNDQEITTTQLASGIKVTLDGDIDPKSVTGKPVLHVFLDLPWPLGEATGWTTKPEIAFRAVEITHRSNLTAQPQSITWAPPPHIKSWITEELKVKIPALDRVKSVPGRFVIDGWAITTAGSPKRYLNCHASAETTGPEGQETTRLVLPTDDAVMGGTFRQWFTLKAPTP